jgi:hypothetical protein
MNGFSGHHPPASSYEAIRLKGRVSALRPLGKPRDFTA